MPGSIRTGTHLGPYEVLALIGEGGMGEVYRARDSRLHRDVAVKVLPHDLADDPDRLRRFEREARAAGQLNHPNIMAVYDVGAAPADWVGGKGRSLPYLVCELIEGVTLRTVLAKGTFPLRRALQYAVQIARGLAAAHSKGIVHRDLKPENLMVLSGNHIKILDFGLAKLLRPMGTGHAPDEKTRSLLESLTMTGTIMGTASYMSPEQIRDQPTDHRTDIFTLGAILYEMISGSQAFRGASHVDRLSAILNTDPLPLTAVIEDQVPGLGAVIWHCLEKAPEDRFQDASDLAFVLAQMDAAAALTGRAISSEARSASYETQPRSYSFRRITYREGSVLAARFSPDGQSVCYSAAWEGSPVELFWAYPGNPESRPLAGPCTDLLSIGPAGEMAVSLRRRPHGHSVMYTGMLARMPLGGGPARELMDDVIEADWGPDGRSIAVVREEAASTRIEFPIGTTLFETPGWVSHMRVSPKGTHIAFLEHPNRSDDMGSVAVVDLKRNLKVLSSGWSSERGLAWSQDGKEVFFTAFRIGAGRSLWSVSLEGVLRPIFEAPGHLTLMDRSPQNSLLLCLENERSRAQFLAAGEEHARDLSWLDWTLVRAISEDGTRIIFDETAVGGGEHASVYMRGTDGSPAVRLGDGIAFDLSPDGQWVLAGIAHAGHLELLPVGAGKARVIELKGIILQHAQWLPGGNVCVMGQQETRAARLYKVDPATGHYEPFSDEGITLADIRASRDGHFVAAHGPDQSVMLFPVNGGAPRPVPGLGAVDRLVAWSRDGLALYTFTRGGLPARVTRCEIETGGQTLWKELFPSNPSGVTGLTRVWMAGDEQTFTYSYLQRLSDLYVLEGIL